VVALLIGTAVVIFETGTAVVTLETGTVVVTLKAGTAVVALETWAVVVLCTQLACSGESHTCSLALKCSTGGQCCNRAVPYQLHM